MRKTAVALALLLLASLGATVPTVSAAEPKVVIIVGATEGTTASYRRDADEIYASALQYTSNVVKVYSPNATWARVKAAVAGAAVVVYLGHGNGWPSPYTYDPRYTTKDGFGLNKVEGAGDSNRVYYGEPFIETLDLSGAVVILNHLCYASGNSESGAPEPTVTVARQRVDNYASAFLRAGAAAVIADAHYGLDGYLRDLFTTSQPIDSLWANQWTARGNVVSFPSTRTPGATAYQDPNTPTSGFYRSLVVRTAGTVVSFGGGAGAGNQPPPPAPVADTTPPQLMAVNPQAETISTVSPNGDGVGETVNFSATSSEPGSLAVTVREPSGGVVKTWVVPAVAGAGVVSWDGRDTTGAPVVDARYLLSIIPTDAAGNAGPGADRTVDVVSALGGLNASSSTAFFPRRSTTTRTTDVSFALSRPMTVTWTLRNADGAVVDTHLDAAALPAGTQTWTVDGRTADGRTLAPGRYTAVVEATDGSIVATQSVTFTADAFLIKPSDTTPGRGQLVTFTLTSAVDLGADPRVSVYQPGLTAWSVATVRLSSTTWRATLRLKAGHTGTVTFKASGRDLAGAVQQTSRSYRLH